jgi:transketolase
MNSKLSKLEKISKKIRLNILEMIVKKKKGHIGGTFSCVDILVILYFSGFLKLNKSNLKDKKRNRFILSKGHACLALYSILFYLKIISNKKYNSYGDNGGLGAQLDMNVPGVDWVTGSLGNALGVTCGFALAAKLNNLNYKSYVLLGDAECEEGSIWEALTFASYHKLNNIIVLVDRNRLSVTDVLDNNSFFKNYSTILKSLNWNCFEVDGHSMYELNLYLNKAQRSKKPVMILCNTIKGKGVSFMENSIKWHHTVPNLEEINKARKELERDIV